MQNYRQLRVWQKSLAVATLCYTATDRLPGSEAFVLTAQMRRSAVSIASNIAEGSGRGSDREFARFLRISFGSACELETQAFVASDRYPDLAPAMTELIHASEEVRRMLGSLIRRTVGPAVQTNRTKS